MCASVKSRWLWLPRGTLCHKPVDSPGLSSWQCGSAVCLQIHGGRLLWKLKQRGLRSAHYGQPHCRIYIYSWASPPSVHVAHTAAPRSWRSMIWRSDGTARKKQSIIYKGGCKTVTIMSRHAFRFLSSFAFTFILILCQIQWTLTKSAEFINNTLPSTWKNELPGCSEAFPQEEVNDSPPEGSLALYGHLDLNDLGPRWKARRQEQVAALWTESLPGEATWMLVTGLQNERNC